MRRRGHTSTAPDEATIDLLPSEGEAAGTDANGHDDGDAVPGSSEQSEHPEREEVVLDITPDDDADRGSPSGSPFLEEAAVEVPAPVARTRRRIGGPVVRFLVAIVGVAVLTATLAVASNMSASRKTPIYAARAEITYSLDDERTPGLLRQDRRLSTQLVMISGRTVLGPVADELGLDWEELAEAVSAEVVDDSEVIRIEVQASDPDAARRVIDVVVDEYLEQAAVEVSSEQRALIQDQLTAAEARRAEITAALAGAELQRFGVPVNAQQLLAENTSLLGQIDRLKGQLTAVDLAQIDDQPAQLLTPPYVLDEPVEPRVKRSTAIGAAVGLLFGLTWVVLVAQFPRFRRP